MFVICTDQIPNELSTALSPKTEGDPQYRVEWRYKDVSGKETKGSISFKGDNLRLISFLTLLQSIFKDYNDKKNKLEQIANGKEEVIINTWNDGFKLLTTFILSIASERKKEFLTNPNMCNDILKEWINYLKSNSEEFLSEIFLCKKFPNASIALQEDIQHLFKLYTSDAPQHSIVFNSLNDLNSKVISVLVPKVEQKTFSIHSEKATRYSFEAIIAMLSAAFASFLSRAIKPFFSQNKTKPVIVKSNDYTTLDIYK